MKKIKLFSSFCVFISELKSEIFNNCKVMVQMSRNMFKQHHDSFKNYREWACLGTSVRIDGPFTNRGGIVATDMREVDE